MKQPSRIARAQPVHRKTTSLAATRIAGRRAALCTLAAVLVGACSTMPVPGQLVPPAGERLQQEVDARGVQIYACRAGKTAGEPPAWAFVAPEATLFDPRGRRIGSHGAGPFWAAMDGSRVDGKVIARAEAPDPADIPWLLLEVTSNQTTGRFSGVTSIQRLFTVGGQPPAQGCTTAHIGTLVREPYRATYRFFTKDDALRADVAEGHR